MPDDLLRSLPILARAWLAVAVAALSVVAGCGGNVCTQKEEHLGDCYESDADVKEVSDEVCTGDTEKEAACLADASCADIISLKAFVDCGKQVQK